jgi:hypothetical protein
VATDATAAPISSIALMVLGLLEDSRVGGNL